MLIQFLKSQPVSEPYFPHIAQLTHLLQVMNSPEHYFETQKAISK